MRKFKYTAVNLQKEKFSGIFIAKDERDLAVQLAKQNLYLISSQPYSGGTPNAFFTLGTGKVKLAELTTFCRQYAIMVNSGMSIISCLDLLRGQPYSKFFKGILDVIYEDVKSGIMLSDALDKHNNVFPDFFRSMIHVGEVSGKLELVFTSLADYYESDARIKKQAKSALSYPIMLLCMTIAILLAMMLYIVPTFRKSLHSLEVEPEGITKIVYDASDYLLANWQNLFLIIFAIALVLVLIGMTKKGKYFYDVLKIKLPLIGKIQTDLITARFARGFALLLSSGMDIVDAMDSIVIVLGNRDVAARFQKATEEVRQGTSLAVAFNKYKLFPDMLIQMVSVGEKTAALDEVLNRSCSFFDNQVETTLSSVTSKIQPIMLMIMGLVVGVMFIAIYSPMLSIMTTLS
ncbi:MAG: type II secretion system F family protein [Clostridia bacterium]|nr:type II secretion system F family protein [Clostridia bacterium]